MKTATYTNKATNETFQVTGLKNIGQAWSISKTVCDKMNWKNETFAIDVKVKIK